MRHLPFFEAIAEQADDPVAWAENAAGLLVLRLFEAWLDSPVLAAANEKGVVRLRELIGSIANPEVQHLLGSSVSLLVRAEGSDPTLVVGPLLAYARYLEEAGRYVLAADVIKAVAEAVDTPAGSGDLQLGAAVCHRAGHLACRMQQYDTAEAHYERTAALAEDASDPSLVLESRVSQARVWIARGNLGAAEAMLDTVIDQAHTLGSSRVEALGRRVRGAAMKYRGRPGDALREFHAAYVLTTDEIEREYLLGDIAACSAELGLRRTARTAHQTLAVTALNETTRSLALVNLLEIAMLDDDRRTFETLWQELAGRRLPVVFRLNADFYHAQSVERWDGPRAAVEAYTILATDAARVGVHEVEFRALEALERLQDQELTAEHPQRIEMSDPMVGSPSTEWQDVANAIEAVCALKLHAADVER